MLSLVQNLRTLNNQSPFFVLICTECLLSPFYCQSLWSLKPWHKIYKENNIFQICFIGHYKPWSASH